MPGMSTEIIQIIEQLLPGFVAAWVFYGLTAHPRLSPFERVTQALIFTVIIRAGLILLRELLILAGRVISLGGWTGDHEVVASIVLGVLLGLVFARCSNNGAVHAWLRDWRLYERVRSRVPFLPRWRWTCRSSFPSEWFATFSHNPCWLVLHLKGERRLYGWPEQYPDAPGKGQFVILQPEWLLDDGKTVPMLNTSRILIRASDVEMVEFLMSSESPVPDSALMMEAQARMIEYNLKKELTNGSKAPAAAATEANERGV